MLRCNVSSVSTNIRSPDTVTTISRWIWTLVSPVLYIFGVFGNVMIFIILRRISSGTSAVFFEALSATDLCLLNAGLLVQWIQLAFSTSLSDLSDVSCKLTKFVKIGAGCLSAWLLVAMTTQRAVSVLWPHRVRSLCTKRNSVLLMVSVVVVVSLLHVHLLYGYGLIDIGNSTTLPSCSMTTTEYYVFMTEVWLWIDLLTSSVLPLLLLMVCNGVLVWKVKASLVETRQMSGMSSHLNNLRTKMTSSVTVTLVCASATFCILSLPLCVYLIVTSYSNPGICHLYAHVEWSYSELVRCVVLLLSYANSAVNFYIYFLTGTKFRDECKNVLWACKDWLSSQWTNTTVGCIDKIRTRIKIPALVTK